MHPRLLSLAITLLCWWPISTWGQTGLAREHPQVTIDAAVSGNNAEPVLFNDVNLNYYDLVSANVQVSKDNDLQKVVFLPVKLLRRADPATVRFPFLENTKLNFAQKNGISTLGIGVGIDNSSPYSRRGSKRFRALPNNPYPPRVNALKPRGSDPVEGPDETETQFEARKKEHAAAVAAYARARQGVDSTERQIYINYYKGLARNSLKLTVGANLSFFEIIGGDKVDLNQDGVVDNYFNRSGRDISVAVTYTFTEELAISGGLRRQFNRSKPLEDQNEVTYIGWSAGAAYLLFNLNPDYATSDEYYKSLFRPAIFLGATAEYLRATRNASEAKDGVTRALVITPFLDSRITAQNQFRIGVPIKRFRAVKNEVSLGPFLQYTLLLSKQG